MWRDRLRHLLSGNFGATGTPEQDRRPQQLRAVPPLRSNDDNSGDVLTRQSNGLEQFLSSVQDQTGLSLLDLAGVNQTNLNYLTGLGHRLYTEDVLKTLDSYFPDGRVEDPEQIEQFLDASFNFRDYDFDGALAWDVLQYLPQPLLTMAVDRIYKTLRPQASLLAFFHSDERAQLVPVHTFRIIGPKSLQLGVRGHRRPGQGFNNRALERLFYKFQSVKFFLTRDSLREVIVKR